MQYENDLMNFKTDYVTKQAKQVRRPFVSISEENVLRRLDDDAASEGRGERFGLELQSRESARLGCLLVLLFVCLTELSASVLEPKGAQLGNTVMFQLTLATTIALSL